MESIARLKEELTGSTTDYTHADLLLDLALVYVLKPGEFAHDIDTALLLIRQAEIINGKTLHDKALQGKAYYTYSNAYREKGDTAEGHQLLNAAISIYTTLNKPEELGNTYFEAAKYHDWQNKEDAPLIILDFEKAREQFKISGDKENQAFALKNIADFNIRLSNFGKSLSELNEALSIYKSIHYKSLQGVYDLINIVNINLGDYPHAVENGLLAVETALQMHDTTMQLCTIYYRLALAYNKWYNNNSREAANYLGKALAIAMSQKNFQNIQMIAVTLCYQFVRIHKPEKAINLIHQLGKNIQINDWADSLYVFSAYLEVYTESANYTKAKFYADYIASVLADPKKDLTNESPYLAYQALITYFIATGQPQTAEKYADINTAYCSKNQNRTIVASAYRFKSLADSAIGDYKSSLNNYKICVKINDSVVNQAKGFQFAQMQVLYNTRQKEDSLKMNLQNFRLLKVKSEADMRTATYVRNLIITLFLFLLVVFCIGYSFKQRSNNKLQVQQAAINQKNEELLKTVTEKNILLEEKEWLLKEVHHRVKNNLQIVISLLNTQSRFLDNKEAIDAIAESRHRMQAMSLIHQKLYQGESTSDVDMGHYIKELSSYLEASYNLSKHISFHFEICAIALDIAQAIPIGLILNETITNAIKYAFVGRDNGSIKIVMHKQLNNEVLLCISDNGVGLPSGFDSSKSESMGMRLIRGLVKQIGGTLDIFNANGTQINIRFATDSKLKSISLHNSSISSEVVPA